MTDASQGEDHAEPSAFSRLLNLVGSIIVGWALLVQVLPGESWVVWAGSLAAVGAWLVRSVVPRRWGVVWLSLTVGMCLGAISVAATDTVAFVPGFVAIASLAGDLRRSMVWGMALAGASAVVIAGVAVGSGSSPLEILAYLGSVVIVVLAGLSRRQFRLGELATRALIAERADAAALADRQRVSRDIHDVLAHSLGGLVVQLDAAEALLEADRPAEALVRVTQSRSLAAAGLDEARRAVDALRSDVPASASSLTDAIRELVAVHRAIGGRAEFTVSGDPVASPAAESALRQIARECLTNARKHAADSVAEVRLSGDTQVVLAISTALSTADVRLAATGGGRGIAGMRERLDMIDGSDFSAGPVGGSFLVTAEVPALAEVAR